MGKAIALIASTLLLAAWLAGQQPKRSSDETLDWLLGQATTAPTTRQAAATSRPAMPAEKANPEARKGRVVLSSGESIRGMLSTTREKPIRLWDEQEKEYRDIPFALIKSMEAKILWERDQAEWKFRESGSDIKEYSGKTYPARELQYVVTLVNGQSFTGRTVVPLYVAAGENSLMYVLNKRQKVEVGQSLKDLVYVKRVELE